MDNDAVQNFFKRVSKMACDAYFSGVNYNPHSYNTLLFESIDNDIESFVLRSTKDREFAKKFRK